MAKPKLSDWLQVRVDQQMKLCLASPVLLIPTALLATTVTWWAIWIGLLWGFGVLGLGLDSITTLTWIVLVVLFVWQFTAGRQHQEEWKFSGRPLGTADVVIRIVVGSPFARFTLDPAAGRMFVQLIALLLCIGPRITVLSWDLVQRGLRLKNMDISGCSAVLAKLIRSQARIPIDNLFRDLPQEDLPTVLPQLRDIDGVVFLSSEPVGLTIAPRLHEDFQEWLKQQASE